jgi:hypothetical protein
VKVTFDTEADSYEQALAMLRKAYGRDTDTDKDRDKDKDNDKKDRDRDDSEPITGIVIGNEKPARGGKWTRGRLESFARGLDPATAEAIRYIATHAPAAPISATLEHVAYYMAAQRSMSWFNQFTDQWLTTGRPDLTAGLLNPLPGIAIPDGPDSPVHRDDRNHAYRMDPAVATVLIQILGLPLPVDESPRR